MLQAELASAIEQAVLQPDATARDVERACRQALEWGFAGVCVHPVHVRQAAEWLTGSAVRVVCAVGFPLGACSTLTKVV
ncbi:MAG TPA: 2-deoxyribose-5-phosphate aldolase, partial [Limnochordales bacterium]